jgi:hypothetical protein
LQHRIACPAKPDGPFGLAGLAAAGGRKEFFKIMLRRVLFCVNLYTDIDIGVQIWTAVSFESGSRRARERSAICCGF